MGFEHKEKLKELLPDYISLLEKQGEIERRSDDYLACPFCRSGDGEKHTAAFHIKGLYYTCFSCGERGDIFTLVGHMEGLPKGDFIKQYNRTMKIMRPYMDSDKPKKSRASDISESEPVDYTEYLHKCHGNVDQTDYFRKRGLSGDIIGRFKLGYDSEKNVVTMRYIPVLVFMYL